MSTFTELYPKTILPPALGKCRGCSPWFVLIGCLATLAVTGEHRLIMSIRPGTWASSVSLWREFLALMDTFRGAGSSIWTLHMWSLYRSHIAFLWLHEAPEIFAYWCFCFRLPCFYLLCFLESLVLSSRAEQGWCCLSQQRIPLGRGHQGWAEGQGCSSVGRVVCRAHLKPWIQSLEVVIHTCNLNIGR